MTSRAFFQNFSSSSGAASGSDAIFARISSSVIFRMRFQSVLPADFCPVVGTLLPCRRTRRDDAPLLSSTTCVDDDDFDVVEDTGRFDPFFAIGKPVVDIFQN